MDLPRKVFLALVGVLLGLGLLMVYSSSITSRPTEFEWVHLRRHLAAAVVGISLATIAFTRSEKFWRTTAPIWFALTIVLLVAVLIPGVGTRVKGAQRWIRIAGVSVQPSEIAKIVVPMMTCWLLARSMQNEQRTWRQLLWVLSPTLVAAPLVLIEPDLGTAAFLVLGTIVALWVSGWPLRHFAAGLLLIFPMGLGFLFLKPYQQRRIIGFLETWNDLDAAPYQIRQSLVSLGAGGLWGEGLGKGFQKLSFLPEANTDFVFAVMGEELGLVGTLGLLTVWSGLYLSGVRLLSVLDFRSFAFRTGFTLLTMFVVQALMNVAVVTAMVPPKGISHPLLSAGGSNLVGSLLLLGIVGSLLRTRVEDSAAVEHTDETRMAAEPLTGIAA